jgi:hypothetical protein
MSDVRAYVDESVHLLEQDSDIQEEIQGLRLPEGPPRQGLPCLCRAALAQQTTNGYVSKFLTSPVH